MNVANRYEQLSLKRYAFLRRARLASKYTIPSLIPQEGFSGDSDLENPYQSLGARGVNNLSSKLALALLPPNNPFYRYEVNEDLKEDIQESDKALLSKIEKQLEKRERRILKAITQSGDRIVLGEAFKHLIVAGNVLLEHDYEEGKLRYIPLSSYVIDRDTNGNLLEVIIKETLSPKTLSENILSVLSSKEGFNIDKEIDIYTYCYRDHVSKRWIIYQETFGVKLEETEGFFPLDNCPYIALRYNSISGQAYGRSYVDEHIGDLIAFTGLNKSMVKGSLAAARIIYLVRSNSETSMRSFRDASSGDVIQGKADDITTSKLDKYYDFTVVQKQIESLKQSLSYAFLLFSDLRRDAERVPTEEIKQMVKELEDTLGNFYSVLAQELQYPYIRQKEFYLVRKNIIPKLDKTQVDIVIITGVEALGRGNDFNKLNSFLIALYNTLGAETVARYLYPAEVMTRTATGLGIDTEGLIKSEEEVQQEQQAVQQAALLSQVSPAIIQQVGKVAGGQNGSEQQQQ